MYKIRLLFVMIILFSGQCFALDLSTPYRPQYKSDFDRAIEQLPQEARKPPEYTPPNPHEGRIQIPGTDTSLGGSGDASGGGVNILIPQNIGE